MKILKIILTVRAVLLVFVASVLVVYSLCMVSSSAGTFDEIEIGKEYCIKRNGFCKKVNENYFLGVNTNYSTALFRVPDEMLNLPVSTDWFITLDDKDKNVLKARYIKGWCNEDYLVLCEEKEDDSLGYLSFEFSTGVVKYYKTDSEVYELFDFDSQKWFTLCKTNADGRN